MKKLEKAAEGLPFLCLLIEMWLGIKVCGIWSEEIGVLTNIRYRDIFVNGRNNFVTNRSI